MSPVRTLLLAAIRGYKRHLSPRKGYSCPCRVHLGLASCSTLGLRAVSRYGAWRGLGVLQLRLRRCRQVREEFVARRAFTHASQAGFIDCDVPCDGPCEMPDLSAADACDCLSFLDCSDCGDSGGGSSESGWKRRNRRRD